MANNDKTPDAPVNLSMSDLAAAFQQGMAAALKQAAPAPVESSEAYLARKRAADATYKLTRKVIQNGMPVQIKGASDATVGYLNTLQPGIHLDKLITLTIKGEGPTEELHINYPCATPDDRLKVYMAVSSFSDMVQKIAKEQGLAK